MVPDCRDGGHRRVVAAALRRLTKARLPLAVVAALAGCSVLLWVALEPGEPDLPRYQGFEEREAGYQPGGPGCDPARLARLPIPGREAADERERCAEAAEEYRLKANDLIQQTRSANAAEAVVALTSDQSRIALVGLIVGGLTLAAASAAALYAYQAATATRQGAKAAADAVSAAAEANRLNRDAFIADQRPWVSAEPFISGPLTWSSQGCVINVKFILENTGRSPAIDVWIETDVAASPTFVKWPEVLPALVNQGQGRQLGFSLFPGQKKTSTHRFTVPTHKIDEWIRWWKSTHNVDANDILPVVFGSVIYFSFNRELHQTPFIFDVIRSVPINNSVIISPSAGDIPAEQLRLNPWWQRGGRPT